MFGRCFGCCITSKSEDEAVPIIDIELVLQDHVWDLFKQRLNRVQHWCLRRENYIVNIPMNYFLFETIDEDVVPRVKPGIPEDSRAADKRHNVAANSENLYNSGISKSKFGLVREEKEQEREKYKISNVSADSNKIEIVTDFVNNTKTEQTYKFRLEKTRKASLTVTFQQGFTIGGKAKFTIGLPKVASKSSAGGEADIRLSISKTDAEVVEETAVLETTSDITVGPHSKYVANVVLSESEVSYDFTVWTLLSMPTGGAPVTIVRKKDNKVFYSSTLKRLDEIFEKYKGHVEIITVPSDKKTKQYAIKIKTTGIIEGVRLSDQKIILDAIGLNQSNKYIQTDQNDNESNDSNSQDPPTPDSLILIPLQTIEIPQRENTRIIEGIQEVEEEEEDDGDEDDDDDDKNDNENKANEDSDDSKSKSTNERSPLIQNDFNSTKTTLSSSSKSQDNTHNNGAQSNNTATKPLKKPSSLGDSSSMSHNLAESKKKISLPASSPASPGTSPIPGTLTSSRSLGSSPVSEKSKDVLDATKTTTV